MPTLNQTTLDELWLQHNPNSWIWLYELVADETTLATSVFRFAATAEIITWGGALYDPAPVSAPVLREDSEGAISEIEITIGDVDGLLGPYLETGDGFLDHDVTMTLINRNALGATDGASWTLQVQEVRYSLDGTTFILGLPNLYQEPFPRDVYQRNRCRWRFTGDGCYFVRPVSPEPGYDDPNILTCDKTLEGTAGCVVHGQNELARGLPKNHPRQYGAFPAIPEGPRFLV